MKKFAYIIALIVGFIAILGQSIAQAQDLPIRSADQLRQYASKQCAYGTRSVWSESIDWNNPSNVTYFGTNGTSAESILESVFSVKFQYGILNTNDHIRGYSYLYDKDWNYLFFGYAEYAIGEEPQFVLWMQNVLLPLTNVCSAEILVLNSDGQTADHISLEIRNGRIVFPWWYSGAPNGILVVRFNDGTTVKYDMWDPAPGAAAPTMDVASYKIEGHYIYHYTAKGIVEIKDVPVSSGGDDSNDDTSGGSSSSGGSGGSSSVPQIKIIEVYNRPSAYVNAEAKTEVIIDVLGLVNENGQMSFERPASMIVENETTGFTHDYKLGGTGPVKVALPEGKLRIIWNWVKFGQPNMIYTGGKG